MKRILAIVLSMAATVAVAQDITGVVNLPVASNADLSARQILKRHDELFGTNSIVMNRPGANGSIGINAALEQDPQKTLLISGHGAITELAQDKFDQLVPITEITRNPFALVVRKDFPANTYDEFVAYARANPGKINLGVQNPAATYPIQGPIEARGKYTTNHIIYAGGNNKRAEVDVASGVLDGMWTLPSAVLSSGIGERVKFLAVTSNKHIPNIGDSVVYGNDPRIGYHYLYTSVWANAKMDKNKQEQLNTRLNAILKSPWGQEQFGKYGNVVVGSSIEEGAAEWKRVRKHYNDYKIKHPEQFQK